MKKTGMLAMILSVLVCTSVTVGSAEPADKGRPTSKPATRMNDAAKDKKDDAMKDASDKKDKAMKDAKEMKERSDEMKGNKEGRSQEAKMLLKAKMHKNDPSSLIAMQSQLGLTPDQLSQLEAIAAESRQKAAAVLTPEQQAKIASLSDEAMSPQEMHRKMMQKMKAEGKSEAEIHEAMMQEMDGMEMKGKEKWNAEGGKAKDWEAKKEKMKTDAEVDPEKNK